MIDASVPGTHVARHGQTTAADLETIALATARALAGADAVERVEVATMLVSYDRPAYRFSFLADLDRIGGKLGEFRMRLPTILGHSVDACGEERRVMLQTLDRQEWPQRASLVAF